MPLLSIRLRTILSLCDYTGNWSSPYAKAGYDVINLDLKNGSDVRMMQYLKHKRVHGVLAAPPCTVFATSGNRWERPPGQILDGLSVVDACLRIVIAHSPAWWALENPVGTLGAFLGPPAFRFHPWEYGDPYEKLTCLWGQFSVPEKTPVVPHQGSRMHWGYGGKSDDRQVARSATPLGFARAFFEANP